MAVSWPPFGEALARQARDEHDQRKQSYEERIPAGSDKAEDATLDYQAWCAIAEWLETGLVPVWFGAWGGVADSPRTPIDWALLERAAESGLAKAAERLDKGPWSPEVEVRHARLYCIHQAVRRQREFLDALNADLRERAQRDRAAAA